MNQKQFALSGVGVGFSGIGLALINEFILSSNLQNALAIGCLWVFMMSMGVIIKTIKT